MNWGMIPGTIWNMAFNDLFITNQRGKNNMAYCLMFEKCAVDTIYLLFNGRFSYYNDLFSLPKSHQLNDI